MTNGTQQLEIRVDTDRLLDLVTVGELLALAGLFGVLYSIQQLGDERALPALAQAAQHADVARDLLCKLVWRDGEYIPVDEARPLVERMSLRQLMQAVQGVMAAVNDGASAESGPEADPAEAE